MNKKIKTLIFSSTLFLILNFGMNRLLFAQESSSEELKVVIAEGSAYIYDKNIIQAKEDASGAAKRNAVEKAVGSLVTSQTVVENFQTISDKILTKTSGYIKKYKIISEGQDNNLYIVKIEAEITVENIKDDLIALNLLHEAVQKPRIMVIIKEEIEGQYAKNPVSEEAILERFLEKDFNVVDAKQVNKLRKNGQVKKALDGDISSAAGLGSQLGADIIIVGEARAKAVPIGIQGTDMLTCHAIISIKAIRASTGKVLLAKNSEAKIAHINELTGNKKALEEAANKISNMTIEEIVKIWNTELMNPVMIQVNIFGGNYDEFLEIIETLKRIQGVESVYEREFKDISGNLDINFRGNTQRLANRLLSLRFDEFRLIVRGIQSYRIDLGIERLTAPR